MQEIDLMGTIYTYIYIYIHTGKIDRCLLMEELDLMDAHATFATLGMALLTLFRISTSDNWSEVMQSTQTEVYYVWMRAHVYIYTRFRYQ
jgi:hypothetical protein